MGDLKPGWVDEAARKLAAARKTDDEGVRSAALGLEPRRNFRRSQRQIAEAQARGAAPGKPKRPLPEYDVPGDDDF